MNMRVTKLVILTCCLGLSGFGLCGCTFFDVKTFVTPEGPPSYEQLLNSYHQTKLKTSGAADVFAMSESGLISQSKSVIAVSGQKKKGYKSWFNMVAFDENELTAQRKYLFVVDERPKFLFVEPWEGLSFDCEMVLSRELLDKPYANENAKRIAILKQVKENVAKDVHELGLDNKNLAICGMMINQALQTALVSLDSSPSLAGSLSEEQGMEFEHTSFDKGRIKTVLVDDIVSVRVRLGSLVKKYKVSLEKDIE